MNKIFLCLTLCISLIISCKNEDSSNGSGTVKKNKKISARNHSITPANAYSDLFLDSSTVEKFINEKKIPDSIAWRIRSFYNSRNFEFAWFASDGLTEQARGFWNLHNNYTSSTDDTTLDNKSLKKRMDNLITEESLSPSAKDKTFINTELQLTSDFIRHTLLAYETDYVKRKEMERFVPASKQDALYLADSLLNKKHKDDKYYENVNPSYGLLKDNLADYYGIYQKGGWPMITGKKKSYKKGATAPEIALIKKRLQLSGDISEGDTTPVFNDTLVQGVKKFQQRHGLETNGIVNETTLKEMNIPVTHRIQQLLINMDRMRWLPVQPEGNLITVNIPAFMLHVTDGNKKVFDMAVVVGKDGHDTRIFTGNLNQVVFSPYWNVPKSIVEKEILPAIEKNPDYLEKENMEVIGEKDGLPEIRQKPGGENALGKVKFLFPNSFNIYFHDTPSKSLFSKDKRAFSHGCIRLSDPVWLANYLLRNQPEWDAGKIEEAMNSGKEKFVKVKNPVPVLITYYTAWVDEEGQLNFREDIYGHDAQLTKKMFTRAL
ncbi:MAG TPA: L,D-transpeptidase family protein [Chitinophagaceae bacterium]|nr:L,D-transpeptidase family protein [Chitinophagaceae bacterium]